MMGEKKMIFYNVYNNKSVKELCHAIKERDKQAIEICSDYFLNLDVISSNSILIPAPQHEGVAIYTKQIADIIAEKTGAIIEDIVKSPARLTLYEFKKNNYYVNMDFYITKKLNSGNKKIFLIDNVVDTGTTWHNIEKVLNTCIIPLAYAKTNNTNI